MTDQIENEQDATSACRPLTLGEKILAGSLLIFFTAAALITLIAYWPDRVPKGACNVYQNKAFHVTLMDTCCRAKNNNAAIDSLKTNAAKANTVKKDTAKIKVSTVKKSLIGKARLDSIKADSVKKADSKAAAAKKADLAKATATSQADKNNTNCGPAGDDMIHLNTLILILVAVAGFLGNLIYVCKSFTAFVGVGEFSRNWILWYFVKPFTAMGLALIVYFALNNDADTATKAVNLNGIVAVAALTGLFTDMAMLKLKDIFEVIVKPNADTRIKTATVMKIDQKNIKPVKIDVNHPNEITIPGENLNAKELIIKINGEEITDAVITPTLIKFTYLVADKSKTEFKLVITDKAGKELANLTMGV